MHPIHGTNIQMKDSPYDYKYVYLLYNHWIITFLYFLLDRYNIPTQVLLQFCVAFLHCYASFDDTF